MFIKLTRSGGHSYPLCQDSCHPDRVENKGGENMREQSGPIRTRIHEQSSGKATAAREYVSR
jgi:hypothetical protein